MHVRLSSSPRIHYSLLISNVDHEERLRCLPHEVHLLGSALHTVSENAYTRVFYERCMVGGREFKVEDVALLWVDSDAQTSRREKRMSGAAIEERRCTSGDDEPYWLCKARRLLFVGFRLLCLLPCDNTRIIDSGDL